MRKLGHSIVRLSSFLRKEVFAILRQPRLVLTLILGPFLILLIFGIGYQNEARALRTLFVAPQGSELASQIEEYATTLGPQLIYEGVTPDETLALQRLRRGEVDVVAVAPPDAAEKIRNSEQAVFTLYHREIDPFQVDYVGYFGQIYTDEVNRRVLTAITQEGQSDAADVREDIQAARQNTAAMKQAVQAGDEVSAEQNRRELNSHVDALSLAVGASLSVLSGVDRQLGSNEESSSGEVLAALERTQENTDALNSANPGSETEENTSNPGTQEEVQRLDEIDQDLALLDERLGEFTGVSADVLVRPFRSETKSIATVQPTALGFFAPAVIALLLQHLAVTFAALSIVRERTVGTMELFRVSPLSSAEALIGKYLSYLVFGAVVSAALTLLLVFALDVPMLGNWWDYALVVLAILFTSLSIGFVISLVSQNESQAVQLTMLVLLASVFFSGFLMSLDMIWEPVQALSWSLPTTYGIVLLRDILLRGEPANLTLVAGLAAIGFALAIVSWLLMRRLISAR